MTKPTRISPAATQSGHETIAVIDAALLASKVRDARESARLRDIHIFHTGDGDTLQRMLNALQPGSYITPHVHAVPPKAESIILLQGSLAFIPFSESGEPDLDAAALLSRETNIMGVDYRAGLWHTFFALEPDTAVFEIKPGPYDPETDKQFAPWAPPEGDAAARRYLAQLEDDFREHRGMHSRPWIP